MINEKWLKVGEENRKRHAQINRERAEKNRLPIGYKQGHIEVIEYAESKFYGKFNQEWRRVKCKCHYCGETFITNEFDIKYRRLECCSNCYQKLYETHLKSRKALSRSQTKVRGITPHPKGYQISKTYKGMRIHLFANSWELALQMREELQEEIEQFAKIYEHLKSEGGSEEALDKYKTISKEAILHRFQVKYH